MVFNAANILLVAAIAVAGMAVAFPVGIGLALVLGVLVNYVAEPKGNPVALFAGVAFIAAAIVLDALAYRRLPGQENAGGGKGLVLAVSVRHSDGLLLPLRGGGHARARSRFAAMPPGKLTPYTAMVFFSLGVLAEQFRAQHGDHGQGPISGAAGAAGRLFPAARPATISGASWAA